MEFYSNNYSKYIETLKAEKSRKAFQELVKNSREIKSEVVSFTENYSDKETSALYSKESLSNKENNKLEFDDTSSLYSVSKPIGVETFLDVDEYSAISTRVEIENGEKGDNEVSSVEVGEESSEDKTINFKASETEKSGNKVAKVSQNENHSESEISLENKASKKEGNSVSLENKSAEKAGNEVSGQITDSLRSGTDLSGEDAAAEKNNSSLIYKIIEEKKAKKELTNSIAEAEKGSGSFKDFNSDTKKNNPYGLTKAFQYFLKDGRKYEAYKYEKNANKYSYYPAGDYATMETSAGQNVSDIFGTITNESNWSATSNTIVSSLKIATSVIDMINLSGPSKNIYIDGVTKNNLRWDLKVAEGPEIKNTKDFVFGYDEDLPINNIASKFHLEKKSDGDLVEKLKTQTKDEDGNLANDTEKSDGDLVEKLRAQTKDEDGNLANDTEKSDEELKENNTEKTTFVGSEEKGKDSFVFDYDNGDVISSVSNAAEKSRSEEKSDNDLTEKFQNASGDTHGDLVVDAIRQKNDIKGIIYKDYKVGAAYKTVTEFAYTPAEVEDSNSNRTFDAKNHLGKIYVIPPFSELAGTEADANNKTNVAFTIPLQNNLQFEQISRAASYNAISFFGRIGDVQQYSKSGSLEAITLTTKYFVDGESDADFSMPELQDIEMKYRSLVLPAQSSAHYLSGDNSNDNFYYFTRPPLINIVLGNDSTEGNTLPKVSTPIEKNKVYKNLFTDIYSTYGGEKQGYTHKIFYKNFVVTNVSIDKNDNDYNYYVKENDYLDKMGFTVSLTILEIDENYLGSTPSFNNYYNTITSRYK